MGRVCVLCVRVEVVLRLCVCGSCVYGSCVCRLCVCVGVVCVCVLKLCLCVCVGTDIERCQTEQLTTLNHGS